MKQLTIQYSHFLGEFFHSENVFPNFLHCFYQTIYLNHFRLLSEFPLSREKPTGKLFLLAFFCSKQFKIKTIR